MKPSVEGAIGGEARSGRVGPSEYPDSAARLESADRERLCRAYENPLLTRPVYLDARAVADLSSDIAVVADVLLSLPDRLADGDETQFARQMGVTEDRMELASIGATRSSRHIGRADVLRTEHGFRMVELNLSSALGGFETGALNQAFLAENDVSHYVADGNLGYVDPVQHLVAYLKEATYGVPGTVGLVDTPTGFSKSGPHLELLAEALAQYGVEAVPTHLGELEVGSAVTVRGRRIHTVHRFFTLSELVVDVSTVRWAGEVLRRLENTAVPIISPLSSSIFGNKRSLAALWEPATRSVLSLAEKMAIEQLVPWSASITSGSETVAERAAFIERCVEERTRLVLKPAFGASGRGGCNRLGNGSRRLGGCDHWPRRSCLRRPRVRAPSGRAVPGRGRDRSSRVAVELRLLRSSRGLRWGLSARASRFGRGGDRRACGGVSRLRIHRR